MPNEPTPQRSLQARLKEYAERRAQASGNGHPKTISHAIVTLEHSGRGVQVLADLSRLLDGSISSLDLYGQTAVLDLLTCAFGGMGMTTRDAIRESLERCGVRL